MLVAAAALVIGVMAPFTDAIADSPPATVDAPPSTAPTGGASATASPAVDVSATAPTPDTPATAPTPDTPATGAPTVDASAAPAASSSAASPRKKPERPAWYGPVMLVGGAAWFASSYIPYVISVDATPGSDEVLFVPIVGNVIRGVDGLSAVVQGRATLGEALDTAIAIWAGVGQVVGLVFMTAGVVLTAQSVGASSKAPTRTGWTVSPFVGPGSAQVIVTGQF